jgi:hypothetical protein
MGSDERMLSCNRLSPQNTALAHRCFSLLNRRMCGLETMQSFLEPRAESVIRLNLRGKDSITPALRLVEDVQECGSWWLLLIGNI